MIHREKEVKGLSMREPLLTEEALAKRWNLTTRTLCQWRWSGCGPFFIKIGRVVYYRLQAVEDFEERKQRKSTSEIPPSPYSPQPCPLSLRKKKPLKLAYGRN